MAHGLKERWIPCLCPC